MRERFRVNTCKLRVFVLGGHIFLRRCLASHETQMLFVYTTTKLFAIHRLESRGDFMQEWFEVGQRGISFGFAPNTRPEKEGNRK